MTLLYQEVESSGEFDYYTPRDLIKMEVDYKRLERINVDGLILEASLVEPSHVEDLAASMKGKRGQLQPIAVRARLNEDGEIVYDIIDGFHRSHALKTVSEQTGYQFILTVWWFISAVMRNCLIYGC